ncbi:hypothetical protein A359_07020 [secondary endosymbiont of Ctenarytaina eucalypti]|uniref:Uncharacterized protein n=1 Tax=secondary endosymbiont of Ctenarytaina eucalypti TaxID=1199245 RepID=J3Z467_9ENTR|nr:hypothetical protein A359_07020 [secondary endosymbiont of Ctenarytaina eucalypti]
MLIGDEAFVVYANHLNHIAYHAVKPSDFVFQVVTIALRGRQYIYFFRTIYIVSDVVILMVLRMTEYLNAIYWGPALVLYVVFFLLCDF